ncbi:hypothetical protein VNO80_08679 [Phaseolus coccineus]|uniref:Uncharacterized protein n=1 Tax=Phaseolus coccineus TaxID=3886 RepID=A0AAN9NB59_PHACN
MGSSSGCGDHSLNFCLELLVYCKGVIQCSISCGVLVQRQDDVATGRFRVPVSQRRAVNGGFAAKHQPIPSPQKQRANVDIMPKQKPQTLDSLFANMKEQRMRVLSMQNNAVQRNGNGNRRLPWGRGRFGN